MPPKSKRKCQLELARLSKVPRVDDGTRQQATEVMKATQNKWTKQTTPALALTMGL